MLKTRFMNGYKVRMDVKEGYPTKINVGDWAKANGYSSAERMFANERSYFQFKKYLKITGFTADISS